MAPARCTWLAVLGLAGLAAAASVAEAQERLQIPSPILTLDQDALFNGSLVAERISAEIEGLSNKLAAENREIEKKLVAEELDLTKKRAGMEPTAFRTLADAFDTKVQGIRAEQDAKTRDLQRMREHERQTFLRRISPILGDIVRDRGAVVVLDRRAVFLSADTIDITQEAIERINAAFNDAAIPTTPDPGGTVDIPTTPVTPDPAPPADDSAPLTQP